MEFITSNIVILSYIYARASSWHQMMGGMMWLSFFAMVIGNFWYFAARSSPSRSNQLEFTTAYGWIIKTVNILGLLIFASMIFLKAVLPTTDEIEKIAKISGIVLVGKEVVQSELVQDGVEIAKAKVKTMKNEAIKELEASK